MAEFKILAAGDESFRAIVDRSLCLHDRALVTPVAVLSQVPDGPFALIAERASIATSALAGLRELRRRTSPPPVVQVAGTNRAPTQGCRDGRRIARNDNFREDRGRAVLW